MSVPVTPLGSNETHDKDEKYPEKQMQKIFSFLHKNNYDLEGFQKSNIDEHIKVIFKKDVKYTDAEGNWINDTDIKVTVEYPTFYDSENKYQDEHDNFELSHDNLLKVESFFHRLTSKKTGGKKGLRKRATRKTRV
jgi:hypothetical protein